MKAEIVRVLRGQLPWNDTWILNLADEIVDAITQTAEYQALVADAERYRLLRGNDWTMGRETLLVTRVKDIHLGGQTLTHELLDAAIDTALEGK